MTLRTEWWLLGLNEAQQNLASQRVSRGGVSPAVTVGASLATLAGSGHRCGRRAVATGLREEDAGHTWTDPRSQCSGTWADTRHTQGPRGGVGVPRATGTGDSTVALARRAGVGVVGGAEPQQEGSAPGPWTAGAAGAGLARSWAPPWRDSGHDGHGQGLAVAQAGLEARAPVISCLSLRSSWHGRGVSPRLA